MKMCKFFSTKKFVVILIAGCLFAAQATQGQWVSVPAHFYTQSNISYSVTQPMILPTLAKAAFTAQAETVAARELWVGNKNLSFHVTARESLNMVHGRPIWERVHFSAWDGLKPAMMRALLLAISQEKMARPLKQNSVANICLLSRSA